MGSQCHGRCAVLTPALVTEPSGKLGAGGCVLMGSLLTGCRSLLCKWRPPHGLLTSVSAFLTDGFPVCPEEAAHGDEGNLAPTEDAASCSYTISSTLLWTYHPCVHTCLAVSYNSVNAYVAFCLMQQLNVLLSLLPLRKIP